MKDYIENEGVVKELISLVKEFNNSMEYVKVNREGKEEYIYKLKNGSSKIFQDIIFEVHRAIGDRLPDDYIYSEIANDIEFLSDNIDEDSDIEELRESLIESLESDVYLSDLQDWASYHLDNQCYIDDAIKEFCPQDYFGTLSAGQYLFKQDIINNLINEIIKVYKDL